MNNYLRYTEKVYQSLKSDFESYPSIEVDQDSIRINLRPVLTDGLIRIKMAIGDSTSPCSILFNAYMIKSYKPNREITPGFSLIHIAFENYVEEIGEKIQYDKNSDATPSDAIKYLYNFSQFDIVQYLEYAYESIANVPSTETIRSDPMAFCTPPSLCKTAESATYMYVASIYAKSLI